MSSTLNGNEEIQNGGESSKSVAVSHTVDSGLYEHAINSTNWIYNVGYLHQDWADVNLTFFQSGLKAHRILLAKSPYLSNIMRNVAPGSNIHLNFADENINQESVHITLQHLYNPSHDLIKQNNAKSILATSYLFGGMPELVNHSYEIIKSSIDPSNIIEMIEWLSQPVDILSNGFRNGNGDLNNTNHNQILNKENWEENENRYGEWTAKLKKDVIDYLLNQLFEKYSIYDLTKSNEILNLFSKLPYELFKFILESNKLKINSMQERFSFTKKIINQRKKLNNNNNNNSNSNSNLIIKNNNLVLLEESVVLAFKGGEGMEIHISRKPKKTRQLWKVES
ncbi:uncharacterized protein I206_102717 [Kwoniella pini CBS 10737]|uniref:BTB domain-containing protein n=1 Tax=Kwoniella pini CBS 10737 TaxID=1296096 RepID=A0A1B9I663_9TREE|nr:uncharacterized protein I206_03071 [Kwoniella pini CBS 10737]OCF51007.1 hypothetical protein I206_03071 [Kwoniella pini CBS 10737]